MVGMTASERATLEEWRRLADSLRLDAPRPAPSGSIIDEICAIPLDRWERLGRVLRDGK